MHARRDPVPDEGGDHGEENLATARGYATGEGAFPERAAINLLGGRFLTDFYATVAAWARWALTIVEDWPDDVLDAQLDPAAYEECLGIAERTDTLRPPC